jgi:hypothetical protein
VPALGELMETLRVAEGSGVADGVGGEECVARLKTDESRSELETLKCTFLGWRVGPLPMDKRRWRGVAARHGGYAGGREVVIF